MSFSAMDSFISRHHAWLLARWRRGWLRLVHYPERVLVALRYKPFVSVLLQRARVLRGQAAQTKSVPVTLLNPRPIARVDPRYLSFSIDISVLAGGQWWEGSNAVVRGLGAQRVIPFTLLGNKLDALTRALGPSYLRIGGSEADKIHYFAAPADDAGALVLTQQVWDQLHAFIQRHDLRLSFTFKYGLFKRSEHGGWRANEVLDLLVYSKRKGYNIHVCELGNELNAYWAFHGLSSQPRAGKLADDYLTFATEVKHLFPCAKVIGPGSAFWPRLGETIKPFSNISNKFLLLCRANGTPLDIVDWHYYPFQSRRSPVRTRRATQISMLRPRALNEYKKYCLQLKRMRDAYFPNAELWTGETGSAQCGGEPKLSDRFASCFWWADQLGQGACLGQQVMIRQSLVGGDYGLLDRLTLKPRPDYWLSWLWQQLMGQTVFAVTNPHAQLRSYCHGAPDGPGKTLLLINLSAKPCRVLLQGALGFQHIKAQYVITAKKLTSKKVRINGKKARLSDGEVPALSSFPAADISDCVPAQSLAFWCFR
ncbi:MAG TPA: glycoside hydrolase [Marinagarivorans sp.]